MEILSNVLEMDIWTEFAVLVPNPAWSMAGVISDTYPFDRAAPSHKVLDQRFVLLDIRS